MKLPTAGERGGVAAAVTEPSRPGPVHDDHVSALADSTTPGQYSVERGREGGEEVCGHSLFAVFLRSSPLVRTIVC